jgi:hypothetical protein
MDFFNNYCPFIPVGLDSLYLPSLARYFHLPWVIFTSTHFRIDKVNAVAEDTKGIWNDPAISSRVLAATVVYRIRFSSCVGTFIVGDHGTQSENSATFIHPTHAVVPQQSRVLSTDIPHGVMTGRGVIRRGCLYIYISVDVPYQK